MSLLLSFMMGIIALGGMLSNADWKYWMSAWALCAFFSLCYHISRFVSILEGKNVK